MQDKAGVKFNGMKMGYMQVGSRYDLDRGGVKVG